MEKNAPAPAAGVFGYMVGRVVLLNLCAVSLRCPKNVQIGNAHNMVQVENRIEFVWSVSRFWPMPHSCAGEPCYIVGCRWFHAFGRGCLHHNRPRPRAFGRGVWSLTPATSVNGDRDRPLRIRRGRQSCSVVVSRGAVSGCFPRSRLVGHRSCMPSGINGVRFSAQG